MKKTLTVLGIFALGAAAGRFFDGAPPRAEAGGGQGGGVEKCAAQNGDVNADDAVDVSDAMTVLNFLFLGDPTELIPLCAAPPAASGVPDTGQTACYEFFKSLGSEVPCSEASCSGQDGSYATGCSAEGRFVDNGDGTVTDHCTGLMWQKDTADTNGDGQSTDQDFVTWCGALAYCEGLELAGHADWRLPNLRELQSIVDYGTFNPSIAPVFGAFFFAYWSSTTYASIPGLAWFVGFHDGNVNAFGKDDVILVRAVRPGP